MTTEIIKTDTLIVGAGQAGVAMSEHLSKLGVPHLVLERNRIAERWRTGRWDSLVANGPAWHDRFPGLEFDDVDPDGFAPKERVADYFEAYAKKFNAPIRTGVEVKSVVRNVGRPGFTVETSEGVLTQTLNIALLASLKGTVDCVTAFSETDFRPDMAKIDVPTLVIHGDGDQIVPFETTGKRAAAQIKGAELKVYAGAPHGFAVTHAQQLNEDLLAFLDR